jgi:hypothetical protein
MNSFAEIEKRYLISELPEFIQKLLSNRHSIECDRLIISCDSATHALEMAYDTYGHLLHAALDIRCGLRRVYYRYLDSNVVDYTLRQIAPLKPKSQTSNSAIGG